MNKVESSGNTSQNERLAEADRNSKTLTLSLNQNVAGLLCYVPIFIVGVGFSILWLVTEPKDNRTLRFHAIQGLCLSGVSLLAGAVISGLVPMLIAFQLWSLMPLLWTLESAAVIVASILCMVHAYQNKVYKLPYLGDFAEQRL